MSKTGVRFATVAMPRQQMVLFATCPDELVAQDAEIRVMADLMEEVDWTPWELKYTGYGQPPIHPKYLACTILFGLLKRMNSSRQLEDAARKHLDFMWLLEGFTPDHSTFAKFRMRHDEALKDLQKQLVHKLVRYKKENVIRMLIDGTRIRANCDRQSTRTAGTIEAILKELEHRMGVLAANDAQLERDADMQTYLPGFAVNESPEETVHQINKEMKRLQAKLDKYRKALEVAQQRDEQNKAHNGKKARPVRVPVTDPDAQVIPNKEGGYAPNYTPVAAVEAETGAILYADVVNGSNESGAVLPAVQQMRESIGQAPEAVLGDGNFAEGEVLAALERETITAYMPTRSASPPNNPAQRSDPTTPVPVEDRPHLPKTGGFLARSAFVFDPENNCYHCPMGQPLTRIKNGKYKKNHCTYYQSPNCSGCPLHHECIKGKSNRRTLVRDEHEHLREAADARMATKEGKAIYKTRAPGIEGVFGFIKSAMGIRQFRVRGLKKVRTEWSWICTAFNLKKLLSTIARHRPGQAPPPQKGPVGTGSQLLNKRPARILRYQHTLRLPNSHYSLFLQTCAYYSA